MLKVLGLKNVYLLPLIGLFFFYLVPSLLGFFYEGREQASQLLTLTLLSMLVYFVAYNLLRGKWFFELYSSVVKFRIGWRGLSYAIMFVYFSVILYAAITAPGIALFEALRGADITTISGLREEFLRSRQGWERSLVYIYAISVSALMPFVIAQLFVIESRWRFLVLGLFLFSLALTLEKSRPLVAILPLIVIFLDSGNLKYACKLIGFLILLVLLTTVLARGGASSPKYVSASGASSISSGPAAVDPLSGVPDNYNLFPGNNSQFYYVLNRVWYIPYVTAIDWLRYKETVLGNENTMGRSISIVALLIGESRINLEREVFTFQWGQNETGTGSANTAFYVDAYLAFGYIGVILYSAILAFCVRICLCSGSKALIACLAISIYYACFNSLTGVLFSGGLGFIVVLAQFFSVDAKRKDPVTGADCNKPAI